MPSPTRKVALIYDCRLAYDLKVMTGVAAYLQEGHHYSVYIEESALKDQRLPDLRSWAGDGIIADFDDPAVARLVMQSGLPAVAFGGGYGWYVKGSPIPYFYANNQAVAKLAADHLLERGFKHFAFCGYARTAINGWSHEREQAFVTHVEGHGGGCAVFPDRQRPAGQWAALQRAMGEWLRKLPKPLGVMAANDTRGRQVLEACRAYDLNVPNEVAVIGVDTTSCCAS